MPTEVGTPMEMGDFSSTFVRDDSRLYHPAMAFGRPTQRDEQKARDYGRWVQQRNPFAIASMVLGVFSLIEFGVLIVFGVASIVLGIVALRQLANVNVDEPASKPAGHRLAWGGILLSVVSLIFAAILYTHRGAW